MVIFWVTSYIITLFNNHYSLIYQYTCTSSQVTFIYIPLYTLKIVSKQLYSDNGYITYILKQRKPFPGKHLTFIWPVFSAQSNAFRIKMAIMHLNW